MFSIDVKTAFFIKIINVIAIDGKPNGELLNNILHQEEDESKFYIVKGIALVDRSVYTSPTQSITIQLEPGDYTAEELIGKKLVSYD